MKWESGDDEKDDMSDGMSADCRIPLRHRDREAGNIPEPDLQWQTRTL